MITLTLTLMLIDQSSSDEIKCAYNSTSELKNIPVTLTDHYMYPYISQNLEIFEYYLNKIWGLNIDVRLVESSELNAWARIGEDKISFSSAKALEIYGEYGANRSQWTIANAIVLMVLGHEFGHHVIHLRSDRVPRWKYNELYSDCLSGYASMRVMMSDREIFPLTDYQKLKQEERRSFALSIWSYIYQLGDYSINSPDHHGLPEHRMMMYDFGVQIYARDPKHSSIDRRYYAIDTCYALLQSRT